MKILVTGGHLGPALAIIEEIGRKADIVFVGRKYPVTNETSFSLEYQEISKRHIPFYNLVTGRLTRLLNFSLLLNVLKMPLGLFHSFLILLKERPDLIISFGGYIGFPISICGFILNIPIYIHEQTIRPGLANQLSGFIAQKIFISFPESQPYFPRPKVILSGNPVRKSVVTLQKKPFAIQKTKPVIYFTGGSLGSHSLNIHVEKIIHLLTKKFIIIHQTGKISQYDDFNRLMGLRAELPNEQKNYYFLRDYFFANELGYIYSISDLVVGRSGANTFFELIAWQKPAIFVPLPWSANNEQLLQATLFQKAGAGEIFYQSKNSTDLLKLIEKALSNLNLYKNNLKNLKLLYKQNAANIIVETILLSKKIQS